MYIYILRCNVQLSNLALRTEAAYQPFAMLLNVPIFKSSNIATETHRCSAESHHHHRNSHLREDGRKECRRQALHGNKDHMVGEGKLDNVHH